MPAKLCHFTAQDEPLEQLGSGADGRVHLCRMPDGRFCAINRVLVRLYLRKHS